MSTRRQLIKGGFAGLMAAGASAVMATSKNQPVQYDEVYDLVIIGAGGAGLSAGGHAAEAGKKVLIIEKMGFPGGSSAISGGQWAASGTPYQKERNIKDNEELFVKDMMEIGHQVCDPELVKAFVSASGREHDWMLKNSGIKPTTVMINAGMSVPRSHQYKASEVTMFYYNYTKKNGAKILTGVKAEHLLWDNDKQEITGVKVTDKDGNVKNYGSKNGVLLATGGFARSPELLAKYSPGSKNAAAISGLGTTGDGIRMAQEYGADVADVAYVKPTYGFTLNPKHIDDKSSVFYSGAIIVNNGGKRFIRENDSYKTIGEAALAQNKSQSFLVFDEQIRLKSLNNDPREKKFMAEKGKTDYGFVGNTIEEVAQKAGIDPKVLRKTVDEYNATAPNGNDSLGRKTLAGNYGKPTALTQAPFVIIPATACLLTTYCGLKVNKNLQVVDVFGEPIKGLYAAGEVCGGFHGKSSMSGTGFAKAFSLGRLAYENMVK